MNHSPNTGSAGDHRCCRGNAFDDDIKRCTCIPCVEANHRCAAGISLRPQYPGRISDDGAVRRRLPMASRLACEIIANLLIFHTKSPSVAMMSHKGKG